MIGSSFISVRDQDYDCFYASCFEVENPDLRSRPLAVQQKQIIVTCNYEARGRGLYKLQLVSEARNACPEVIIVLGEDLTRFRDHSKDLYHFLRRQIWSGRAEKLGFDEVWLDVTDMVDYNACLVNRNSPSESWFCLDKDDPTRGFAFDASSPQEHTWPPEYDCNLLDDEGDLTIRLVLGSHLASYLRNALEKEKGFTSTAGVSTNKTLSKLAGNVHKPRAQTTLMPPYVQTGDGPGHVLKFLDDHEIGRIPGIGQKGAARIRKLVKGYDVGHKDGLVTNFTKEAVTIHEVRQFPGMGPDLLETTFAGPGMPKGFGGRVWDLLHGVDGGEVGKARDVPRQISIEDTYMQLKDLKAARKQLTALAKSLIRRLRIDLTEDEDEVEEEEEGEEGETETDSSVTQTADSPLRLQSVRSVADPSKANTRRWIAHPRTIRLSTRERKAQRSFARISRSGPMPSQIFNLQEPVEVLAAKLAEETLLPMFSKLVQVTSGFDVFLINVAATNMQESAGAKEGSEGRDIGKMFRTQAKVLSEWRVADRDIPPGEAISAHISKPDSEVGQKFPAPPRDNLPNPIEAGSSHALNPSTGWEDGRKVPRVPFERSTGSEDAIIPLSQDSSGEAGGEHGVDAWQSDDDDEDGHDASLQDGHICRDCGAMMPAFALEAHLRFHRDPY